MQHSLDFIQQAIHEILGSRFSSATKEYFIAAKEKLIESNEESLSFITDDNPLKKEEVTYLEYLLNGSRREATLLITELIQEGIWIKDIYQFIYQVSQYEVGRLLQYNKFTVAHEHYCTAATLTDHVWLIPASSFCHSQEKNIDNLLYFR